MFYTNTAALPIQQSLRENKIWKFVRRIRNSDAAFINAKEQTSRNNP
jgi:hypothetical protein